jgi:hypothetical protein
MTMARMQAAFEATSALREVRTVGGLPRFSPTVSIEVPIGGWDTNCFYRRLGVPVDATRAEIARAYIEMDPEQSSLWYATAARVLLSRAARRRYDAVPLGAFWSDDPSLVQSRIEGDFQMSPLEWGIYADRSVEDDQAAALDPAWRWMLSSALSPHFAAYPHTPPVAIGATARSGDSRWQQVGLCAVLFVPLDAEPSLEYVLSAANKLMQTATPVVV